MDSITRPPLLREQILAVLRNEIVNRRPVGALMPTEMDLAREFRVARKTVRAAYAILEAEGLIERRRGLGTFIIAKTPRSRRTGDVDLMFFSSAQMMFLVPFYARLIGEICSRASAANFYVHLFTHDSNRREFRYDWKEHASRLDEAVGCLAVGLFKPEALASLASRMPVVAVDTGGPFDSCDSVVADDFEAGRLATQHLLDLGHRRIAFLGPQTASEGSMFDPAHLHRFEGYRAAMQQAQIWPGEDLCLDAQGRGHPAFRVVSIALQEPDRPTAFVAVDDGDALAGIDAAVAQGLRVPQDVSFVGIGDVIPSSSNVQLTTVRLGPEQMGRAAVELLQRRLAEPAAAAAHHVVPVQLVERETATTATW